MASYGSELLAAALAGKAPGERPLRHVAEPPARNCRTQGWPPWAEPDVIRTFTAHGINALWSHQAEAAELAHAGRHVVVSNRHRAGKVPGPISPHAQCAGD